METKMRNVIKIFLTVKLIILITLGLSSICYSESLTTTHTYDMLKRLIQTRQVGSNGLSITYDYEYDAIGNMVNVRVTNIIDSDLDGLSDSIELQHPCLDPYDADSDDDGILDGLEDADKDGNLGLADNETDPCDADTDGDGILDGTEIGVNG